MVHGLIFLGALVSWAMVALTFFKAPTLFLWKAAILAGEYGHFLAGLPLLVGWLTWAQGGEAGAWGAILCAAAAALLLRPAVQAAAIGWGLPVRLERAFGKVELARAPFSFVVLMRLAAPRKVRVRTLEFARPGGGMLALDFYGAEGRAAPAPCVVVIHGGGWDNGDRAQLAGMNHHLARRGYAVAAVSYGLAPEHPWPSQADDIGAAIGWLKQNAAALQLDASRFVLLGRSAGGQLAAAFACSRPDPAVRGVVSLYGPQDQVFAWKYSREDDILNATKLLRQFLGGTPETAPAAYASASPYLSATGDFPPALLVHGARDALVWHRQSERFHERLDELRVANVFVSLPWATHAFDFNLHGPSGQLTTYAVEWFLAAVTR